MSSFPMVSSHERYVLQLAISPPDQNMSGCEECPLTTITIRGRQPPSCKKQQQLKDPNLINRHSRHYEQDRQGSMSWKCTQRVRMV